MDPSQPLPYIIFAALFLLSGFFSGSETALFSLNKLQINRMAAAGPGARLASRLIHDPERLIITILMGNTFVNVAISSFGAFIAASLAGGYGVTASVWIITFLLLIFGEITPKLVGIQRNEQVSALAAWPLFIFGAATYPARKALRLFSTAAMILLGGRPRKAAHKITREDLHRLVVVSQKQGTIERDEGRIMENIFSLESRSIREVMTPLVDMLYVEPDAGFHAVIELSRENGALRIPVYDPGRDRIPGVIFVKDLIAHAFDAESKSRLRARDLMREPLVASDGTRIDDLLHRFKASRVQAAVIVDDHGAHTGWVMMDDILDEIAGEIDEEYERKEFSIERLGRDSWLIPGRLPIRKFNEAFKAGLPQGETFHTVAGFVMMQLARRLPDEGQEFRHGDWVFRIAARRETRIMQIQVFRRPEEVSRA